MGYMYANNINTRIKGTTELVSQSCLPGTVARSDPRPPGMRTVAGSILTSSIILPWSLVMK